VGFGDFEYILAFFNLLLPIAYEVSAEFNKAIAKLELLACFVFSLIQNWSLFQPTLTLQLDLYR
jgi:hypothetical protein